MTAAACFCLPMIAGGLWTIVILLIGARLDLLRIAHALEKRNARDR